MQVKTSEYFWKKQNYFFPDFFSVSVNTELFSIDL